MGASFGMTKKDHDPTLKRERKRESPIPERPDRAIGRKRKYETRVWAEAVCRLCGARTATRFIPRDPKAVLCDECFEKEFGRPPPGTPSPPRSKLYSAVCSKCGEGCEVPWKPTPDNPAVCWYCRNEVERPKKSRLTSAGKEGTTKSGKETA